MNYKTKQIWDSFSGRLSRFISLRVSNKTDAEDIFQEVFLKIHANLNDLEDDYKLPAWIFAITRNTITDYYRKNSINKETELSDSLNLHDFEKGDDFKQVKYCLNSFRNLLPEKYRKVIELSDFEGIKQKEIAKRLGISLPAVKSRVRRGRKMIKENFTLCCKFEFDNKGKFIRGDLTNPGCTLCNTT